MDFYLHSGFGGEKNEGDGRGRQEMSRQPHATFLYFKVPSETQAKI